MTMNALQLLPPEAKTCFSPVWQVLYYEAIRGNHSLLFRSEIASKLSGFKGEMLTLERKQELAKIFSKLLLANTLDEMRVHLGRQNEHDQVWLYLIYLRKVDQMKETLRSSMS